MKIFRLSPSAECTRLREIHVWEEGVLLCDMAVLEMPVDPAESNEADESVESDPL